MEEVRDHMLACGVRLGTGACESIFCSRERGRNTLAIKHNSRDLLVPSAALIWCCKRVRASEL